MKNNINKRYKKGFGMIEIVASIGIISIVILGLTFISEMSLKIINDSLMGVKSSFLLEEGIEAVKTLRDESWASNILPLAAGDIYYLNFNGAKWQAVSSNAFIDNLFERKFVLEDVYRDINQDIASSGIIDSNTKKITVFVSFYGRHGMTTKQISAYITNLFNN